MQEFIVNEFITLKLENNVTNIYVKDELFSKCKFLLLNVPSYKIIDQEDPFSVDDAEKYLSKDLEIRKSPEELGLTPEDEFHGHCSNLQAWAESNYNIWLLHSNLAFPLLKRLTEAGDPLAENVFKNEVARRFLSSHSSVVSYLIEEGYFEFLQKEEFVGLLDYIDFNEIDVEDFIDGIIDYYQYKHGSKYAIQLLKEFPKQLISEKFFFYIPLLRKLTLEGEPKAKKRFFKQVKDKFLSNDPWANVFLKKEGFLEYLDKEKYAKQLDDIFYPKHKFTLRGHIDRVNSVVFSNDSKYLISAGGPFDKSIRLWDVEFGELINMFYGHSSDVSALALSPVTGKLASASWDKSIMIWDYETGRLMKTLSGHQSWVRTISFAPFGMFLISGSGDNRREEYAIKIWSLMTGRVIRTIEDFMNDVNAIAISPDGEYIVTACSESRAGDFTGKIWELETGDIYSTLEIYSKSLLSISISPNSELIVSGSADGSVKLWTIEEGELIRNLNGHKLHVHSVQFSPDGKYILSSSGDGTIKIWESETGDLVQTLIGHSSDAFVENIWVNSIAVSLDGKHIASGAMDNTINLWEIDFSKL